MQSFIDSLMNLAANYGGKIFLAIIALICGRVIIKALMKFINKSMLLTKMNGEVRTFSLSFIKIGLNVVLIISIIGILGVPMASVLTVLASAGVAVGLALQGSLSNLAGGIMLMIFRPFKCGDYIESAGVSGTVKEITMFYSVLITPDNKRISVPNGTLMNANIINYSSEDKRRVDLAFACGKGEDPAKVQSIMIEVMNKNPMVLNAPEPAFARLSGGSSDSMQFTVRAWTKGSDYWTVYYDLTQSITEALGAAGISAPAVRYVSK